MLRGTRSTIVIALTGASAACASIPDPPAPVGAPARPVIASRGSPAPPTLDLPPATAVAAPLPALPLEVAVRPARPRQASVVSVHVIEPPGPALERPSATLAGVPVSLTRDGRGWIGLAALPLDSAGVLVLELAGSRDGRTVLVRRAISVQPRTYPSTRIRISAGGAGDPEVDARIARERELIQSRLRSSEARWYPTGPFDWPRPAVRTSPFGQRRVFNGSIQSRHLGLDLRGRRGEPTYAAAAGRILLAGSFYYQGNAVYVDHGLGLVTAYFHFSSIEVEEGQLVETGQLLGRVGSTGRSTAPHLHWSAYVDGVNVDPESLIGFHLGDAPRAADVEARQP
ncbi:MAG: peptidoglycan DD-metalloendopeptidase family protein [Gemmatimonadota bacterium]|nr:peptidoglycan DD-metalloendopeptidase family protein [Gemmatimonadota bacterium]